MDGLVNQWGIVTPSSTGKVVGSNPGIMVFFLHKVYDVSAESDHFASKRDGRTHLAINTKVSIANERRSKTKIALP